jgi:hypothetical protein
MATFQILKRTSEQKIGWLVETIAVHYKSPTLRAMADIVREKQAIILDYRIDSTPRYGYGKPLHPQLEEIIKKNKAQYVTTLQSFLQFKENFLTIPTRNATDESTTPCWINHFVPGLDSVALYSFLALNKPKRYFEVGSGNSTRFARKAISDHNLPTKITSIDPEPRADISKICDKIIRQPLENVDLAVFEELEAGDILFVDNSHRCLMNSDVTVVFLEILPRLKPGVLLEIHDITLPWDYPRSYIERYYSEQYLLAVLLLASRDWEVVLPNWYVSRTPEYSQVLDPLWKDPALAGVETHGCSFWMRKK